MSDHFRPVTQIVLSADGPPPSIRRLAKRLMRRGLQWTDLVEIKHGDRIVAFGTASGLASRAVAE